jgi:hypothetical protein
MGRELGMKRVALALVGVFVLALAVVVAKRLSADAMAVVVGIVCGIGASIPTGLLMLYVLNKRDADAAQRQQEQQRPASVAPTVMIIGPPAGMQQPYWGQPMGAPYFPQQMSPGAQRQFQLLGGEGYDER